MHAVAVPRPGHRRYRHAGAGDDVWVRDDVPADVAEVLEPEALRFVAELTERFGEPLHDLLQRRASAHEALRGGRPRFSDATASVRHDDWTVPPPPSDLKDRRVEITGPTDPKRVIQALHSGAPAFMADFEDAHAPVWSLTLRGQSSLRGAVRGDLHWISPEGQEFRLRSPRATLMVRPRGLHLREEGLRVRGAPVPASLFDAGLYLHHNALRLARAGSGAYLYLPKVERAEEALWWQQVLSFAEERLGLAPGSVRTTVLVETLPAAFQMHEILYALQPRALGLNFGRWDYLFSFVKSLWSHRALALPPRPNLSMDAPFLRALSTLLVETCHTRGAQAIGGMAADLPVRDDASLTGEAVARVTADKERELTQGYEGTWVAHPALVPVALGVFRVPGPPRLARASDATRREDPRVAPLLDVPHADLTEGAVRSNAEITVRYLASWLAGRGAVAIHHRMEDMATAEICRAQLWQWVHLGVPLGPGRPMSDERFRELFRSEMERLRTEMGEAAWGGVPHDQALSLVQDMVLAPELDEFMSLRAGPFLDPPH